MKAGKFEQKQTELIQLQLGSGDETTILNATEAAYEHEAHSTARELEEFLTKAGRF